jgi:hypothetical protein
METNQCLRCFALLGIAWVAVVNLCVIYSQKNLNKVAEDALSRFHRFGRPDILLDVIRPRLKEVSRRALLSRPDMASARTNRRKFQLSFKLVLWQVLFVEVLKTF